MANHTRQGQTPRRYCIALLIVATYKLRIGFNGLAGHFVEGQILGTELQRCGDNDTVSNSLRKFE